MCLILKIVYYLKIDFVFFTAMYLLITKLKISTICSPRIYSDYINESNTHYVIHIYGDGQKYQFFKKMTKCPFSILAKNPT